MEPNTDLQGKIIQFFTENQSPDEEAVGEFSVQLGLEPNIVKNEIYNLLSYYIDTTTNKVAKRAAQKNDVAIILDTKELISNLVGKINGYYLTGFYYENRDGNTSIDGREILEEILEKLVKDFKVGDKKTKITIDSSEIYEHLNPGYSIDYSIEDASEDFIEDPIGILSGMQKALGVRIDPYSYEEEPEPEYEEQPPEEYEYEYETEERLF